MIPKIEKDSDHERIDPIERATKRSSLDTLSHPRVLNALTRKIPMKKM